MQLVQDYRTISWELPKGWTIVFTGNPDNNINQVTSMDAAQLSRMKHVTLKPDVQEWAKWAETQDDVDKRLISFLLKNPEMMIAGERTNPRSLTEFGRALKRFPNLEEKQHEDDYKRCYTEAYASLDEDVVNSLMVFLVRDVELVIEPETILTDIDRAIEQIKKLLNQAEPRLDILHITNSRLLAHLSAATDDPPRNQITNIQKWLVESNMPQDMVFAFIKSLWNNKMEFARKVFLTNDKLKKKVAEVLRTTF